MQSVLLTGASGFLGRYLHGSLANRFVVDTLGRSSGSSVVCNLGVEGPALTHRYHAVVHCAARVRGSHSPEEYAAVNVDGTRRLLRSLESAGIPSSFVFVSSVAVYGLQQGCDIPSTAPLLGTTPYALSKIQAERQLADWCAAHGCRLTILRLPLVVASDSPGLLADMRKGIRRGTFFTVGGGAALRSVVSPQAVCCAVDSALDAPEGCVRNVCSESLSVAALARRIAGELNRPCPRNIPLPLGRLAARIGDMLALAGLNPPIDSARLGRLVSTLTFAND